MNFATAVVRPPIFLPTSVLRTSGFVTSSFQGVAYAEDPRNGQGYLFQLQAVSVGPLDVENLRIHRFRVDDDYLTYMDTQTVLQGGHVQSASVRISSAGNPYVWAGLERYDNTGAYKGTDVYRIRYRFGGTTLARTSPDLDRVYTGDGNVTVVGSPDWTIVLRRVSGSYDYFEFHSEKDLLDSDVQADAKDGDRPKPKATVKMLRSSTNDNYQSAYADAKYSDSSKHVYRISGGDTVTIADSGSSYPRIFTTQVRSALTPDVNTEPEGLFNMAGDLYFAVQCGSVDKRRVAYFRMTDA